MCQGIAYRTLAKFNRKVEDVSATADTVIKPFVDDGIDFEGWCGISLANRGVIEEFTAIRANFAGLCPRCSRYLSIGMVLAWSARIGQGL